jgi:uncharacterized protein YgiM (DUF1202 family)
MVGFRGLSKLISLFSLLLLGNSCALLQTTPPPTVSYIIPSVTYFRDLPGYASRNVATVYRGEQVVVLSKIANDWCQVKTVPGGQVGWIQRPLLSPVPIPTEIYTVQEAEAPLRDSPQKESISRQVLHRGDKIRKLSSNQQGWWWVLVEKDESLGWLPPTVKAEKTTETAPASQPVKPPEKTAAEGSPPAPAPPPYLYVAVATLDLRHLPLVSSQVVKVLKFKDKVEKIGQSRSEWLKVRYPETGAQGWAQAPTLTESPLQAPKVFPPPKKRLLKRPRHAKPTEPEAPQPGEVEPEAM